MTLNTQGLVLYFYHITQLFGNLEVGDNLNDDNLRNEFWVVCTWKRGYIKLSISWVWQSNICAVNGKSASKWES